MRCQCEWIPRHVTERPLHIPFRRVKSEFFLFSGAIEVAVCCLYTTQIKGCVRRMCCTLGTRSPGRLVLCCSHHLQISPVASLTRRRKGGGRRVIEKECEGLQKSLGSKAEWGGEKAWWWWVEVQWEAIRGGRGQLKIGGGGVMILKREGGGRRQLCGCMAGMFGCSTHVCNPSCVCESFVWIH